MSDRLQDKHVAKWNMDMELGAWLAHQTDHLVAMGKWYREEADAIQHLRAALPHNVRSRLIGSLGVNVEDLGVWFTDIVQTIRVEAIKTTDHGEKTMRHAVIFTVATHMIAFAKSSA